MAIKLNTGAVLDPLTLVDTRLLVQANSGAGKSWLLRLVIEQAAKTVPTIVLDSEGEFTSLREAVDNKMWKHQAATNGDGKRTATSPNLDPERHIVVSRVTGYRPTCPCEASDAVPCVVFDPFAGSGTTLQTARVLGRRYVGCEISEEYAKLAEARIVETPKWAETRPKRKAIPIDQLQKVLF